MELKKIIPRWGRKLKGKIPNISNVITVKKNNPQMGTETRLFARIDLLRIRRLVKLNNPLMGTETYIYGLR